MNSAPDTKLLRGPRYQVHVFRWRNKHFQNEVIFQNTTGRQFRWRLKTQTSQLEFTTPSANVFKPNLRKAAILLKGCFNEGGVHKEKNKGSGGTRATDLSFSATNSTHCHISHTQTHTHTQRSEVAFNGYSLFSHHKYLFIWSRAIRVQRCIAC